MTPLLAGICPGHSHPLRLFTRTYCRIVDHPQPDKSDKAEFVNVVNVQNWHWKVLWFGHQLGGPFSPSPINTHWLLIPMSSTYNVARVNMTCFQKSCPLPVHPMIKVYPLLSLNILYIILCYTQILEALTCINNDNNDSDLITDNNRSIHIHGDYINYSSNSIHFRIQTYSNHAYTVYLHSHP